MCDCIQNINEQLAEMNTNTQLDIPITWTPKSGTTRSDRVQIGVCKLDNKNRKKPTHVIPTYCPFCGKRYKKEKNE